MILDMVFSLSIMLALRIVLGLVFLLRGMREVDEMVLRALKMVKECW
jgi:hypothetical protein